MHKFVRKQWLTRDVESTTRINAKNTEAQRTQINLCVLCTFATSAFHAIPGDNPGFYVVLFRSMWLGRTISELVQKGRHIQ